MKGARKKGRQGGEDIRVHVVSREQAYQWVLDGTFENGASIIESV